MSDQQHNRRFTLYILHFTFALFLLLPIATHAVPSETTAAEDGLRAAKGFVTNFFAPKTGFNVGAARPEIVAGKIIQGALVLIGVVFGILVIYGGYLWMIARGNEEDVKKSIEILKTAITGFIIVIAAYAITSFIVNQVITAAFQ